MTNSPRNIPSIRLLQELQIVHKIKQSKTTQTGPFYNVCLGSLLLLGVRLDFGVRVGKLLESQGLFDELSTTIFPRCQ